MDSFDATLTRSRRSLKPIIGGIAVVVFLVAVFFFARSGGNSLPKDMVLYYGDGCPHCANVEAFVTENNVEQKVQFVRKEVYKNKSNAREMGRVAKSCGFPTDNIGIPFFWTGTQCLTGDKDIIAFFQQQL
ncbi:MAG: hypothetical protein PHX87_02940 [Candidatus Peribacteraceae bacterium]|nr:hypothetical protein [Candidatus Peribacteraceae bacterium]MDD5742365.1 hypothetical protein [Candidatus Peribacteraceae bacterium]